MFGLTCSRLVELLSVAVEQLIFSYNHRGFKFLDYIKVLLVLWMHFYDSFHVIFDHSNHLIQVCIHPVAHAHPLVAGQTAKVPRCSGEITITHQRAIWGPAFGSKSVELATTPQRGLHAGFMH